MTKPAPKAATPLQLISWTFSTWPVDVYPNTPARGRHIYRAHKKELLAAGALGRAGREIMILGAGYARWLAKQATRVLDFDVPANRPEHAAKRNNNGAERAVS